MFAIFTPLLLFMLCCRLLLIFHIDYVIFAMPLLCLLRFFCFHAIIIFILRHDIRIYGKWHPEICHRLRHQPVNGAIRYVLFAIATRYYYGFRFAGAAVTAELM